MSARAELRNVICAQAADDTDAEAKLDAYRAEELLKAVSRARIFADVAAVRGNSEGEVMATLIAEAIQGLIKEASDASHRDRLP